ncbi:malto-oligosyltrehalose trehalohydrolase [Rhizobium cauense]|uniref:malto-oligosyltrehalose trehalohydrolase n=1 Tax=Rhizobium cauense TaxID=1166683 RepID=UPI001C6ECD9E|nr:malto-oligosyltrehalose trehalohydrolase [Rhizobium cauense]MBW9117307.1 malto-oligosyltrehalose trehalohydrolase [Rhizobium cauense]
MSNFTFGPVPTKNGTQFRLWAPFKSNVKLRLHGKGEYPMARSPTGWHQYTAPGARPGSRYSFVLDDGLVVPDPASRYQPNDVHGPSEVVDLSGFRWKKHDWKGRPWEEIVIYELHLGAFTKAGGYVAALDRLDHLKRLGVTAIQIMPIADFPGRWGWGYDGVLPYAPDSSYGRPEQLQMLVDAAHERNICVFLDVVYNHFGPDGNYMAAYAPLFTDSHKTPWGNGINYDDTSSSHVRQFIIENAVYWISEFKLDGLRLDAVHAIHDRSASHVLHDLAERLAKAAGDRMVHLILENEDNDSSLLTRDTRGNVNLFTAQWNDDLHHALHVKATRETFGYYADYDDDRAVGRALAEGFVFQGQKMPYRGKERGKPSAALPPTAFVSFIQNHDQIGNRALGDRALASLPVDIRRAVAATYMLSPQIPMLFMGEEWNASEPFPYFCDFEADLNEKVRQGRREELARLPGFDTDELPDPTSQATFEAAKLDWTRLVETSAAENLAFYQSLLAVRRARIIPLLRKIGAHSGSFMSSEEGLVTVTWRLTDNRHLRLDCNLSDGTIHTESEEQGESIFRLGLISTGSMGPWSVSWRILS